MPTVQARYAAATAYVRRAIASVASRGVSYSMDPITGFVEWYAGKAKTEEPQNELSRIESRWLRATSEETRTGVARDAELLADRVEENLPGAPQDRARTNLVAGELQRSTPSTSYAQEVDQQAGEVWGAVKARAAETSHAASGVGKLLLAGGAAFLGWKAFRYWRWQTPARQEIVAGDDRRLLDANLARAANERDAVDSRARGRLYSLRLTREEIEALAWLRDRYGSAEAFINGLRPVDDDAESALALEFDQQQDSYGFQIRAIDIRKALRETARDGGAYGAIPNLSSDSVQSVLDREREAST